VLDYELDDRSVVTGVTYVVAALDQLHPTTAYDVTIALLRIGVGMGRASGPYGRSRPGTSGPSCCRGAAEIRRTPSAGDNGFV
jgi:hypothetical protein